MKKIDRVILLLEGVYGRHLRYSRKAPLAQLIATILSQRTNYADEKKAFDTMWEQFGSWQGILEAPVEELRQAIAPSNYAEQKAPRIQAVLEQIQKERGDFDLSFLKELPVEEAQDWLMRLPGVGPKTTTFLLLFVFRLPVLPVDTHVHRVSQRLGLIGPKVSEAKAHQLLKNILPPKADELLNFHRLLFKHGQKVCTWSQPYCSRCPLTELCDSYLSKKDLFSKYQARIS